jgi:hypothetical protein
MILTNCKVVRNAVIFDIVIKRFIFVESFLAVPHRGSDDGSSMSDMSGITSASAKTYIAEESSLVIETLEKGMTK